MNEFIQKSNITDKDFIIHVLNNLPEVLDGLENCLTTTRANVLTIDVIREKLNHRYKKLKAKKKKKPKRKRP